MMVDTSVVISCSDDHHIKETLASVDEDVEVIASITPNETIQRFLESSGVEYVISPRGNHSITLNKGIAKTTRNKVILIDSDCIFLPETLKFMSKRLEEHPVVSANVIFKSTNFITKQVARCRTFDNGIGFPGYSKLGAPAFRPGLGFNKKMLKDLNITLFNPDIPWTEDADFTFRLGAKGVHIHSIGASVEHIPTSVRQTAKSYWFYGNGDALRKVAFNQSYHRSLCHQLLERWIKANKKLDIYSLPFLALFDMIYAISYMKYIFSNYSRKI